MLLYFWVIEKIDVNSGVAVDLFVARVREFASRPWFVRERITAHSVRRPSWYFAAITFLVSGRGAKAIDGNAALQEKEAACTT